MYDMDDNISKLFKHGKEKAHEDWRVSLPDFKFKDEGARQAWNTYLDGCLDGHSQEVARFAATWASYIDNDYVALIGLNRMDENERSKVMTGLVSNSGFKNSVFQGREKAMLPGVTTGRSFNDGVELIRKVSAWGEYVAELEKNARIPDEGV